MGRKVLGRGFADQIDILPEGRHLFTIVHNSLISLVNSYMVNFVNILGSHVSLRFDPLWMAKPVSYPTRLYLLEDIHDILTLSAIAREIPLGLGTTETTHGLCLPLARSYSYNSAPFDVDYPFKKGQGYLRTEHQKPSP